MKPKENEFQQFIEKLMDSDKAPQGYKPWLIRCKKNGKDPDTKISWKAEKSRLTPAEAKRRLKNNWGNVGIAGREHDQLILVDIDDPSIEDQLKPTLKIRSRSRVGTHAIYWAHPEDDKLPCNIPTQKGELRSSDQYVVAPGSYVPCKEKELKKKVQSGEINTRQMQRVLDDEQRGYYTLDNDKEISKITFKELPRIFQKEYYKKKKQEIESKGRENDFNPETVESDKSSALYELEITDLTARGLDGRDPHPLHTSSTGANWSISQGLGHCWRHAVSLNSIQFLCVEAGYLACHEAGTPHKGSGSAVAGNDEAIWVAWKHAKENNYIPEDDPVPTRALKHIAEKNGIKGVKSNGLLKPHAYSKAIKIVEEKY